MSQEQETTPKVGELFSRAYTPLGQPTHESEVLRRRVGAYVQHELRKDHYELLAFLKRESGGGPQAVPGANSYYYKYEDYFANLPRDAFMNAITLVWRFLRIKDVTPAGGQMFLTPSRLWYNFIRRAFKEENVGYVLDKECGVRFSVDNQFELQRTRALQRCSSGV